MRREVGPGLLVCAFGSPILEEVEAVGINDGAIRKSDADFL